MNFDSLMNWRRPLLCGGLWLAVSSVACSDDEPAATAGCPRDDPNTGAEESECKALSTIAAGKEAVQKDKRKCVTCHGDNMAGTTTPLPGYSDTFLGEKVELFPPNLTSDPETGIGKWTDDALVLAIRTGIDNESQGLCPQMSHFSNMSEFEVYSIIKYLRSLPAVKNAVPRSVCPPTKTKEQQGLGR